PFTLGHEKLVTGLAAKFSDAGYDNVLVRHAMSYSDPSIAVGIQTFIDEGCDRIVVVPLYPQSAHSTTGSVHDSVEKAVKKSNWLGDVDFIDNYHDHPTYIKALAASIKHAGFEPNSNDMLLFSFHSIPLVDIEAGDTYELQSGASSLQIASELGIDRKRWTISYQCRFDKSREWLTPFTKDVLMRWADADIGRLYYVCPGFAVDCLETIYDIGMELKPFYLEKALEAGHPRHEDDFVYVPCLNSSKAHAKVLFDVVCPYVEEPSHGKH
ncbi:MAG: ferrochelatase, partial [Raoultibacter sp.]